MTDDVTLIAVTGFGGTGSSAVTDLLTEFEGVKSLGNSEFWFCQKPHGISDLQFKLHCGSHRSFVAPAIHDFYYAMLNDKELLKLLGKSQLSVFLESFINNITDLKFSKKMAYEELGPLCGYYYYVIKPRFYRQFQRILNKLQPERCYHVPYRDRNFSVSNIERYLLNVQKLTNNIFTHGLDSNVSNVVVDQLVPATNISRYQKYFKNLEVIVVDRDPRDLYLLNKLRWNGANYICNTDNVYEFINWYKYIRFNSFDTAEQQHVYRIKFENLVHDYEKTKQFLFEKLNLSQEQHKHPKAYFNPDESKQNTMLYKQKQAVKFKSELKVIENELRDYLWELT
ncbi:hypothetical protein N8Z59_03675 [Planktomarina temperata]|nr:hypothetical protein [Planktomarina temperata]